jgi:hypothetical protein
LYLVRADGVGWTDEVLEYLVSFTSIELPRDVSASFQGGITITFITFREEVAQSLGLPQLCSNDGYIVHGKAAMNAYVLIEYYCCWAEAVRTPFPMSSRL